MRHFQKLFTKFTQRTIFLKLKTEKSSTNLIKIYTKSFSSYFFNNNFFVYFQFLLPTPSTDQTELSKWTVWEFTTSSDLFIYSIVCEILSLMDEWIDNSPACLITLHTLWIDTFTYTGLISLERENLFVLFIYFFLVHLLSLSSAVSKWLTSNKNKEILYSL